MDSDGAKMELVRKLAGTIQSTLTKSEQIAKAVYDIRATGLDIELSLDGTISLSKWPEGIANVEGSPFVTSMHIRVSLIPNIASE